MIPLSHLITMETIELEEADDNARLNPTSDVTSVLGDDTSDVILLVAKQQFPVHRSVLCSRSDYFQGLFYSGLRESDPDTKSINLQESNPEGFKLILDYMYSGDIRLDGLSFDNMVTCLDLANQYGLQELMNNIVGHLRDNLCDYLSLHNVCLVYHITYLYDLDDIRHSVLDFIDQNAMAFLQLDDLVQLSAHEMHEVIASDTFSAIEERLLCTMIRWGKVGRSQNEISSVLDAVRFPEIPEKMMRKIISSSDKGKHEELYELVKITWENRYLDECRARFAVVTNSNVASRKMGALVDPDCPGLFNRLPDSGLDITCGTKLIVELSDIFLINQIKVGFVTKGFEVAKSSTIFKHERFDHVARVETRATSSEEWRKVFDFDSFKNYSVQEATFSCPLPVRFVRIYNSSGYWGTIQVTSVECFYDTHCYTPGGSHSLRHLYHMGQLDSIPAVKVKCTMGGHKIVNINKRICIRTVKIQIALIIGASLLIGVLYGFIKLGQNLGG